MMTDRYEVHVVKTKGVWIEDHAKSLQAQLNALRTSNPEFIRKVISIQQLNENIFLVTTEN